MEQITTLVASLRRLRRDHQRLIQAVEAAWPRLVKYGLTPDHIAYLSPMFILQHADEYARLVGSSAIIHQHGLSLAIQCSKMSTRWFGLHYRCADFRMTLTDLATLSDVSLQSITNNDEAMIPAELLSAIERNPLITRDLYDYLMSGGYNVSPITHLRYALDQLTTGEISWSYDATHGNDDYVRDGLPVPPSFPRISDAARAMLHVNGIVSRYLNISLTSPDELLAAGHREYIDWRYLTQFYESRHFSIQVKLETAEWAATIPMIGANGVWFPHPSWEQGKAVDVFDDESFVKYYTCELALQSILANVSWLDYTDYVSMTRFTKKHELPPVDVMDYYIIGAPVAWWTQQCDAGYKLMLGDKFQIAIERDLPGTAEEFIRNLQVDSTRLSALNVLGHYERVRSCYNHRLVKAIARLWFTKTFHWLTRTRSLVNKDAS